MKKKPFILCCYLIAGKSNFWVIKTINKRPEICPICPTYEIRSKSVHMESTAQAPDRHLQKPLWHIQWPQGHISTQKVDIDFWPICLIICDKCRFLYIVWNCMLYKQRWRAVDFWILHIKRNKKCLVYLFSLLESFRIFPFV